MPATALVLLVPEAEPLVQAWRTRHDPVATRGMPAHVTLVYPFLPQPRLDASTTATLGSLFLRTPLARLVFREVRCFPEVVYLAPEPAGLVVDLVRALVALFPEAPPYGGAFPTIVPHLTVAHASEAKLVETIASELGAGLPLEARVDRVALWTEDAGFWRPHVIFPLGESPPDIP
jgi:hypothetical protein